MKVFQPHIKTKRIIQFTLVWVILSQFLFLYEYSLMQYFGVDMSRLNLPAMLFVQLSISIFTGIVGSSLLIYLSQNWLRRKRYKNPKREQRIFMFLDLRSSTSIAEHLGEEQYFKFLRDVFEKTTPCILKSRGEIYQYVGDEIVISWPLDIGIRNANCIRCFFYVQKCLEKQKEFFMEKYGLIPEFKAGLHYGHVMTGEIGVVKRDIAFSGDVLNTTSRIEGKCNELGVDLLLSEFLLIQLKLSSFGFSPKRIGEILLRGKKERIVLYTVELIKKAFELEKVEVKGILEN